MHFGIIEEQPEHTIAAIEDEHGRYRNAGFERKGDLAVFAGALRCPRWKHRRLPLFPHPAGQGRNTRLLDMAIASITQRFSVSAEVLWALIGDFGNTGKWSGRPPEACVQTGEGVGSCRTLTLADGRQIVDRLEDMGHNFYTYSIVTSPLPVRSYRATMAVKPEDGSACTFTWSGEFEPEGMTDEAAVAFFENVYRSGIRMMESALAQRA